MNWERWRRRLHKLREHPRPFRLLASRVLWHSGMSTRFTADLGEGLRVRFYPSSISAALWVSRDARNEDVDFLRLVLRPGDAYVDCGANIGHLAIVARSIVGAAGKVVAFEANPRIYEYCVANLELNGFTDVSTKHVALGETHGSITIGDQRADDQNRVGEGDAVVAMQPLDELVELPQVTLLKIDVEGFELFVLRGAARLLARTQIVYCELSADNSQRFGYHPSDAEALLSAAGFVFARRVGHEWELAPQGVFAALSAEEVPRTGYNLVAIKREALPLLEARGVAIKR